MDYTIIKKYQSTSLKQQNINEIIFGKLHCFSLTPSNRQLISQNVFRKSDNNRIEDSPLHSVRAKEQD